MSVSPTSQPTGKRKRKSARVVDSDNESDYEAVIQEETPVATPIKPTKKAITRKPKPKGAKASAKVESDADVKNDIVEEDSIPVAASTSPKEQADGKGKSKAVDTDGERPAKRQRLPNMKRKESNTNTPAGSSTPVVVEKPALPVASNGPPFRQIKEETVTNEVDMRGEGALSQLLKRSSGIKAENRYDLTTSEKMEVKKAELAKLREDYIAQKAREMRAPFDLGAQNRKLVDVQRMLEEKGSRVCVNVVGSCIDKVHKGWYTALKQSTSQP